MLIDPPLCDTCKRLIPELDNWHCAAFPEGIPEDIMSSYVDHHSPVKGDHGLQYVPKDTVKEPVNKMEPKITKVGNSQVMDLTIHNIIGKGNTTSSYIKSQISNKSINTILLDINSPGGSVFEGIAIMNALKEHPATIHGKVSGVCASIASVILMGCDTIEMTKNSMLMVHMPMIETVGNAEDLRKEANLLDKMKENIIDAYKSKLCKPGVDLEAMLKNETWLTPEQAKDLGFCDIISDTTPKLLNYFDFSKFRYKVVPEAVMNMYDVSASVEKTIEDPVVESEFRKFINNLKRIFHLIKEEDMRFSNELEEEKIKGQELEEEKLEEKEPDLQNVDEEVLKKVELLMAENAALKAKIAELTQSTAQLEEEKVEEEVTGYVNKLIGQGKVRPADVNIHVESLISRRADVTKVKAYKAMLESLPVSIEIGSHFADKSIATDEKASDSIEKEARKLFKDYKAQGKNVTLGDCIKEAHQNIVSV